MTVLPVQHRYGEELSQCYGCGKNNEHGLHITSFWDGKQGLARFTPRPEHIALPGFVYGGLLASLVDCHGVATAAAFACAGDGLLPRFVTASLHVDFLRPTPLGPELELRGTVKERQGRKIVVLVEVLVHGQVSVRGEVVAAPMPAAMCTADGPVIRGGSGG